MQQVSYTLTTEDEMLYIKEVLQRRLKFSSRLMRKLKVHEGGLILDGKEVRLRDKGGAGQVLTVTYPEESSYFEPENIPLDVVCEDEDLLIINKQPGLVVHPTKNYQTGTLANAITWHMKELGQDNYKLRFVNRLDRDTSGLVIVGKNSHTQDFLMHCMEDNKVEKTYIALVHGIPGPVGFSGTVDAPIDKDPNHVARRHVTPDGYPSVTHFRVLAVSEKNAGNGCCSGCSALSLRLETGRTHQIRVHMAHIGHPLIGDELYAQLYGYPENPDFMTRQALHACHLVFPHPRGTSQVDVSASLPEDMKKCVEYLGLNI